MVEGAGTIEAIAPATRVTNGAVNVSPTTSRMPLVPNSRAISALPRRSDRTYKRGNSYPPRFPVRPVAPPRWLADEMLGRLARYLRFVGCDTAYVRGLPDDQLLRTAELENRVILTRDRALARRSPRIFRIDSTEISEQFRAVRGRWPEVPVEPRFERCTECNGVLGPYPARQPPRTRSGAPPSRRG